MRHCFHSILVTCPGKPYEPVFLKHVQDHLCNIRYNSPKLETVQIHSQKTSPSESHIMGVSTTLKRELQLHVLEQTQCGGTKSPMHIFRFHFLS